MRYEWTERFAGDWRRLSEQHRELFRAAVPEFSKACDAYVETGDVAVFPAHLRVKPITSAAVQWRRIGSTVSLAAPERMPAPPQDLVVSQTQSTIPSAPTMHVGVVDCCGGEPEFAVPQTWDAAMALLAGILPTDQPSAAAVP